ncbi:MAG: hypothetical protein WAM42_23685 [Candidatus Nitrosopolaris sp.]
MSIRIATYGVYDMILDFKFNSAQVWDRTLDTIEIFACHLRECYDGFPNDSPKIYE